MTSTEPRPPRSARLRRWAAVILAVLLPAILLRSCVVSTYRIKSESMEPTLLTGDLLLVVLDGVDPGEPRRWDVALFDDEIDVDVPDDVDAVIKRIVGLSGDFIQLRDGDVYTGPTRESLTLERKPDDIIRWLLVPLSVTAGLVAPWVGPASTLTPLASGGTRVTAGGDKTVLFVAQPVRDGMLDTQGTALVADTALSILVGEGPGVLDLRLREGADRFIARLAPQAGGGAVLHHNLGGGDGRVAARPDFPGLRPGQRILFWNVDNGLRLFVDGDLVLSHDYGQNASQVPGTSFNNVPAVGVAEGDLELLEVTVLRDLHYGAQGRYGTLAAEGLSPCKVLDDQLFVLGDLSHRSHDSRHFGPVPRSLLLGRPWAIYWPSARTSWLSRAGLSR